MPEYGVNAVLIGARMVAKLDDFGFNQRPHPVLDKPTLNVGTFSGGENVNSVPDWAEIGIDIRTVPGMEHGRVREQIERHLAPDLDGLAQTASLGHVWTDPRHPWVQEVFRIATPFLDELPEPRGARYFSDASVLQPAFGGAPTIILGPGEPQMAHQTDEYCLVARIREGVTLYGAILAAASRPAAAELAVQAGAAD